MATISTMTTMEIIDRLLQELLSVKESRPGTEVYLAEEDIFWLCRQCRQVCTHTDTHTQTHTQTHTHEIDEALCVCRKG